MPSAPIALGHGIPSPHLRKSYRIFPNWEACLRLVTALCMEQSEEWESGRQYLDMTELPLVFRQEALMALVG